MHLESHLIVNVLVLQLWTHKLRSNRFYKIVTRWLVDDFYSLAIYNDEHLTNSKTKIDKVVTKFCQKLNGIFFINLAKVTNLLNMVTLIKTANLNFIREICRAWLN